ncbi:hypothetical protein UFOVP53_134 [uncultured Caudovirales phage]|uniref:Uncharacterized protein n=1 Tax=uncultured Caudovirales phage TaxID=2100421 RepID=A0A6J5KVM9_9CAUD|nr:hypothetical protein UFOVP53_134 [uncultured Caudovirales phage]
MISKIFNFFFPKKKTMIQLAKDKILQQNLVISTGIDEIDLVNGQFFLAGILRPRKNYPNFDYLTVLFNSDSVAIKQEEEVLYLFNKQEEIDEIRNALTIVYNSNKKVAIC